MDSRDIQIELERYTKFYRYVTLKGRINLDAKLIKTITITPIDSDRINSLCTKIDNKMSYFEIHALRASDNSLSKELSIQVETKNGSTFHIILKNILQGLWDNTECTRIYNKFKDLLNTRKINTVLDIGGRNRSDIESSPEYPNQQIKVLDIHPGSNVDIVGDAHNLPQLIAPKSFSAVLSRSVFEHLAMPWKVVSGINHCLKVGGLCMIQSHQTIGMHDIPWDFWRFSDQTWKVLFNEQTGFRILDTELSEPLNIIPFNYGLESMENAENSAGFLMSAVLAEKTHDVTDLTWNVDAKSLNIGQYPLS